MANVSENITFIKDPTVHFKPGKKLIEYLQENSKKLHQENNKVPVNIKATLKNNKNVLLKDSDLEWLDKFLKKQRNVDESELLTGKELDDDIEKILSKECAYFDWSAYLEEKDKNLPYLSDLLEDSELILPKNEVVQRNPELAKRIEKLKKEQEEREYKEMTKNVDMSKKFRPEDTLSYEMNMMNRHLIAVAQFLVSVAAGFAFGFLGVELIIGDLNFGVRLLLGISCALIIALAEFYFLAKHLNQEDKEMSKDKPSTSKVRTKVKLHKE